MPSIKDTFDKSKYDSFLQDTNYSGALNYLTELQQGTDDYDERKALQPFISNLRQKIHRDESMIRYALDDEQKKKYYFINAINEGNTLTKGANTYYDTYTKELSQLGDGYSDKTLGRKYDGLVEQVERTPIKATQLEFNFSKDAYKYFLNNLNITEEELNNNNILVGDNNGNKTISINKSNPFYYKVVNSVYDAHLEATRPSPDTFFDALAYPFIAKEYAKNGVKYVSRDNRGNIVRQADSLSDGEFNGHMANIKSLVSDARRVYNNLEEQANKDLAVSSFSLPWKTAAHARADELLSTTGDTEEYNKTIQRLDGQLAGALVGLNLGQQNVWATGDSDDPNYHALTAEEKIAYQQILRDAIREGRLGNTEDKLGGVHMAMLGDKFGYQIDILPKSDSKGSFPLPWDNSNIHRTIFIENPWPEESMTQAFESRTEFQAMKELILMNQYKYPFDMADGSVLEMGNELMGIYKKSDGTVENVTREQALNLLNENFIKVQGVEALQRKYKPNASQRRYNIEAFENAIDSDAWAYALSAAEELVPKENKKAYMDKVYDLYQSILNGAGYKGKRAITITDEE